VARAQAVVKLEGGAVGGVGGERGGGRGAGLLVLVLLLVALPLPPLVGASSVALVDGTSAAAKAWAASAAVALRLPTLATLPTPATTAAGKRRAAPSAGGGECVRALGAEVFLGAPRSGWVCGGG